MALPGDVIEHPITKERITFLKTTRQTGGEYLRIELAVAPGGFLSAPHIHPRQEERFWIQAGCFWFEVAGERWQAKPGDRILVPPGTPHSCRNVGETEAIAIIEYSPALLAEEFFETVFGLAQDGLIDPRFGAPEMPWLAMMFHRYRDFARIPGDPIEDQLVVLQSTVNAAERAGFSLPYPYPYDRQLGDERRSA